MLSGGNLFTIMNGEGIEVRKAAAGLVFSSFVFP
jgi:hypothetical protein